MEVCFLEQLKVVARNWNELFLSFDVFRHLELKISLQLPTLQWDYLIKLGDFDSWPYVFNVYYSES